MAKRPLLVCFTLCVAMLLTGCAPLDFQNTADLLRAPELGQGMGDIQKTLAATLNSEPQYKYPKEGDQRSPLILADLDGDGHDEGVLVYSPTAAGDNSSNVHLAVLEQDEPNEWRVTQDQAGHGTEVAVFQAADLLDDGTLQLLVGYSNALFTSKALYLYSYADETLTMILSVEYSRLQMADFTGGGNNDLVVVSSSQNKEGPLQLSYIPTVEGRFAEPQVVTLDVNFESCDGIYAGFSSYVDPESPETKLRTMVIDGLSKGTLSSQLLYYQPQGGHFYSPSDANTLRGQSSRTNSLLRSRDIDGDGVVEIPTRIKGTEEIVTPRADKQMEFVEWKDYTMLPFNPEEEPVYKQFGLLDSDRAVYVRLPDEWQGGIQVDDGAGAKEWRIRNSRTQETLLTLRTLAAGAEAPVDGIALPGFSNAYLAPATSLTSRERSAIEAIDMS